MRWVLLLVLAACDHRPAPPRTEPPPQVASGSVPATPPAGSAAMPANDQCLAIGARIADIIISATTDPTQKAAYEQERTKLVKRFSENCAREAWPEGARTCFLAAKTAADIEACSRQLPKPQPPPPPPAGSAGSAAGSAGSAGSAGGAESAGSAAKPGSAAKRDPTRD